MPSVSRSRTPRSGSSVVTAQRPDVLAHGDRRRRPTRTCSPIHPSSACGSTPSMPIVMRKRRPSTGSLAPAAPPQRVERCGGDERGSGKTRRGPPRRPRAPSARAAPAFRRSSDSASLHGPSTSRPATGRPKKFVSTRSPSSHVTVDVAAVRETKEQPPVARARPDGEQARHALRVDERTLVVDEVEAPVAADAGRARARSRRPRSAAAT